VVTLVGSEAEQQIESFFHRVRTMPDMTRENLNAPSKEQQFLDKWKTLTEEQKRPITEERFLLTFGIKHEPHGRQITITNRGVEPQINGVKYSYDLPDYKNMMHFIGEKVNVFYDPYDMSRVLVTNGKDIRFIATNAILHPRALQDTYANSRHMLNIILSEKREQVKTVAAKAAARRSTLDNIYDTEAVLLAPYMTKELKNNVEDHYINHSADNDFEAKRIALLDQQFGNQNWD
ncbi:MAG: Mu transposase C-terminal domain-containing protein, partial [Panacibacter sp.]